VRFEDCDNCALAGLVTEGLAAGTPERGAAITLVRSSDMAVEGCHVVNPHVRGIELESCRRCRVANNTVVDRRETPTMREAIRITGESRHNMVVNNLTGGATQKPLDVPAGSTALAGNVDV
jgi:parallel beta-helix repeat protein